MNRQCIINFLILFFTGMVTFGQPLENIAYVDANSRASSDQNLRQSLQLFDFIENRGQWDSKASYFAKSNGLEAWFEEDGLRFNVQSQQSMPKNESAVLASGHSWDMRFEGQQDISRLISYGERPTNYNYLKGDRSNWLTCVKGYSELRYLDVYPLTDLRFYSRPEGLLEFDFILYPGADLDAIQLRFEGLHGLGIAKKWQFGTANQLWKPATSNTGLLSKYQRKSATSRDGLPNA